MALLVGLGASLWALKHAREQGRRARLALDGEASQRQMAQQAQANETRLREQAQRAERIARLRAYASDMNLANQAIKANNFGRAMDLLNLHRPTGGEADLRGWEWRYLWQFCRSDALRTLYQAPASVAALDVSHDGLLVGVACGRPAGVQLIELLTGDERSPLATDLMVGTLAFHPQRLLLAVGGESLRGQHEVRLLDLSNGDSRTFKTPAFCWQLSWTAEQRLVGFSMTTQGSSPSSMRPLGKWPEPTCQGLQHPRIILSGRQTDLPSRLTVFTACTA
jgi:hypothetical protein